MAAFCLVMLCFAGVRGEGLGASARTQTLTPNPSPLTPTDRYYPETGHTLAAQFVPFYDRHGGLPLFGYPITEARVEGGYLVQWTERERLEWHPENQGTPHEVLLGLLGRELTRGLGGPAFEPESGKQRAESSPVSRDCLPPSAFCPLVFPETGHSLDEPFKSYWLANGGLAIFGYPISEPYSDDSGLRVQWFERARFEYHPELPAAYVVSLGLLGVEALSLAGAQTFEVRVVSGPAPDPPTQLGLAQGGESDDPGFFDNVRETAGKLGPALVRLDNIFNYYNIVSRAPDGTLQYHWEDLDRIIDGLRAMGKEPFICLSYNPFGAVQSPKSKVQSRPNRTLDFVGAVREPPLRALDRNAGVQPPGDYNEWAALVRATVAHLNGERKLGIRYWEVWNEPNQWDFWKGSFEEYLKLYDVTARAVISADAGALVGGPAFSSFEPGGIAQFLEHEAAQGAGGRVDFLSWHAYGVSQEQMAAQIRAARELAARFPQFHPQLLISEFNVSPGGPGDTSAQGHTDKVQGAIALLKSIESMQRERLDRALLFELKDGRGPSSFWGRWGILTNDGQPKPIFHALNAYLNRPPGMLPVEVSVGVRGEGLGASGPMQTLTPNPSPLTPTLGVMAFGGPARSTLMLWYTGQRPAQAHISLPEEFAGVEYNVTLFDETHNNPARSGDARLQPWLKRNARDLVLDLSPDCLVLLTSMEGLGTGDRGSGIGPLREPGP